MVGTIDMVTTQLIGIGLYTPNEAQQLIGVSAGKIRRWLRGHKASSKQYDALWTPQIDLDDGDVYLGFRDLMEMRTAHAFMSTGLSAQLIRKAILEARKLVHDERPLSTTLFKTDGRSIFLEVISESGSAALIDIFKRQYAFKQIIEQSLKDVEFDGIAPGRWWPASRARGIIVDPARSFGQPIDAETGIPTATLAGAVLAEGGIEHAARSWRVPASTARRAFEFEQRLRQNA